jgi:hypothetical protein
MTSKTIMSSCTIAPLAWLLPSAGARVKFGNAAKPARQLFPDVRVFVRNEGPSFVVRHGQQDFNEMHGSPRAPSSEM